MVELDADRLKCPLRRMSGHLLEFHWYRLAYDLHQLPRSLNGGFLSRRHNVLRDIPGELILSVISDNMIEFLFAIVIDDVPGRQSLTCIHPHIQWRIFAIGESPLCRI